jgi:alpha-1,2-glucosyltransferase
VAVFCRQTNAVWLVAIAVGAAARRAGASSLPSPAPPKEAEGDADLDEPEGDADLDEPEFRAPSCVNEPASLVSLAAFVLARLPCVWQEFAAFGGVLLGFAAFLVANGGVVVGDRAHHEVALHTAQAGYALAAAATLTLPLCLATESARAMRLLAWEYLTGRCFSCSVRSAPAALDKLASRVTGGSEERALVEEEAPARGARVCAGGTRWLLLLAMCVAASLAAGFGTIEHPFLLADNRHYTFYAWKYVFKTREWLRFAAGPVYVLAAGVLGAAVVAGKATGNSGSSAGLADAILLCTLVSVGLTPVLEPRYWTPAVLLAIAHMPFPSSLRSARGMLHFALIAGLMLVYVIATSVFVQRPFTWGDGSVARFMW